ncbi:MAG: hypothetical protein JO270_10855 [Acidobacteriaceae bacterium]|nr:hypothetical protein [Acidobacteriaceae bacterium]MBV8571361.1 hypothetical protein [Acidobacteriaceae bacterium]
MATATGVQNDKTIEGRRQALAMHLPDLGNLLLGIAVTFAVLIVGFEWVERRRESKRERLVLDAIEREYELFLRTGRL